MEATNSSFILSPSDNFLTCLSKIADLKVISRTSTLHYKSAPENLREIARQLAAGPPLLFPAIK